MIIIAIMTVVCKCCNEKRSHNDVIVYDDYSVCSQFITYYENNTGKKNTSSLEDCDVYTLRLSTPEHIHYAFVEWGRAQELGKILVVIYDFEFLFQEWKMFYNKIFKYMMKDSKKSFKKLSPNMKDKILKNHKNFGVENYKQYKEYLSSYLPR